MKTVSVLMLLFGAAPRGEVIELTTDHCFYCDQVAPTVHRLQQEGLPIRQIHATRQPEEARRFGCDRFPTFLVVVDDKVISRTTGAVSEGELRRLVASIPKPAPAIVSPKPTSSRFPIELGEPAPLPRPAAGQGVVAEVAAPSEPEAETSLIPKLFRRQPKPAPEVRGQSADSVVPAARLSEAALAASVRLKLHAATGVLLGSGTIIENRVGRTLVLSAGKPFSQLPPGAKIEVEIPPSAAARAAGDTRAKTFIARLVKADEEADVSLIEFPSDLPLPVARIAPSGAAPRVGDKVACIGGLANGEITRDQSRIEALNKYVGPDTIECSGVPLPGRCGGGLFNENGQLIGVCIAVAEDPNSKTPIGGMYCGLKPIHELLRSLNLTALFETATPETPDAAASLADANLGTPRPMPVEPTGVQEEAVPEMTAFAGETLSGLEPVAAAMPQEFTVDDDQEIIVYIRSRKDPDAPTRVIHIHKASPKLRELLNGPSGHSSGLTSKSALQQATMSTGGRRLSPPPLAVN